MRAKITNLVFNISQNRVFIRENGSLLFSSIFATAIALFKKIQMEYEL